MPVGWTTTAAVLRALGPSSAAATDPYLGDCVAAANDEAFRKRAGAGYTDQPIDGAAPPSADVALGTTMLAVDLYRARGSADSFASYDELAPGFVPTGGSWSTIRRLLGIGRAQVDTSTATVNPLARRR